MSNEGSNKDENIGALWEKTAKNGNRFLTGKFKLADGTYQEVIIFKNDRKQTDRHPDYRIFKRRPREDQPNETNPPVKPYNDDDAWR